MARAWVPPVLLLLLAILWTWVAIAPLDRFDWFLENLLVFLSLGVLVATYRRFPLDDFSYLMLYLFLCLHIVGSHWSYSNVPMPWRSWGLARNPYDRLVHTMFGVLLAVPLARVLEVVTGVTRGWALSFAVTGVVAFGALYEVLEWGVVAVVAPELGNAFLGAQGDEFDAVKDIAVAGAGALVAVLASAGRQAVLQRRMARRTAAGTATR